ncbi:MAG: hypothetical protein DRJ38_04605 [Thermoprotei archaeon]|nr:MAG: hypothetical protein DRJ38_04605 [Thermoprotei archaeon]
MIKRYGVRGLSRGINELLRKALFELEKSPRRRVKINEGEIQKCIDFIFNIGSRLNDNIRIEKTELRAVFDDEVVKIALDRLRALNYTIRETKDFYYIIMRD